MPEERTFKARAAQTRQFSLIVKGEQSHCQRRMVHRSRIRADVMRADFA
jgi:hypothetical protein